MTPILTLLSAVAVYPATPLLDEFRAQCVDQSSLGSMVAIAEQNGWVASQPQAGTDVAAAVDAGKKMFASLGVSPTMRVFSKTFAGRNLNLIITSTKVPFDGSPRTMTNCNIYDFQAPAAIDVALLESWAGRKPQATDSNGASAFEWRPGLSRLSSKTRVGFVRGQSSDKVRVVGGLVLSSTVVEERR